MILNKHPYPPFTPNIIKLLLIDSFPPIKLTRYYIKYTQIPLTIIYGNVRPVTKISPFIMGQSRVISGK